MPGALDELKAFLQAQRMKKKYAPGEFEAFERGLHERVMKLEREVLAEEIAASDVEAEAIVVEGKTLRRVLRSSQTYMTAAGEVVVERWLYRDRSDEKSLSVCPLEKRLGIVDFWTPEAAKQALWVVTQMTPGKSAEMFERLGNMAPSKSSLDRLPKNVSKRWEADRGKFEEALRESLQIPEEATTVLVSLDGVLAPMEEGNAVEKRAERAKRGRSAKGSVGYQEIGCGTLAFCNAEGDMLSAIRVARAPEFKKMSLKGLLTAELAAVLAARPDLRLMKVADAGGNNWEFLSGSLPAGDEAIDFYHATEHLHRAVASVFGDATRETQRRFELLRVTLRDDERGVDKVIRSLAALSRTHPQAAALRLELKYIRKHRHRMRYAALTDQGLPIGSGVVEATCKSLVSQRLKLSGMRWSHDGAQAILTTRGWDQSDRFDEAWALIAATFQAEVRVLANVIPLHPAKPTRASP
jgi:hypothetical protein